MKLPKAKHAFIEKEKFNYLFSKSKEYFRKIGFNDTSLKDFEEALLTVATNNEIKTVEENKFGIKYVIEGLIDSPIGKKVRVRTVWSIDKGEQGN